MVTLNRPSPGKRPGHGSHAHEWDQRETSGISRGDRVSHPAFGQGVVSRFMGEDKVEVLFRDAGRKLLHLEYTTLEKV